MTKYKCGHNSDGIIILDDNELSMVGYLTWVDSVGLNGKRTQCWECFNKNKSKDYTNKQYDMSEGKYY